MSRFSFAFLSSCLVASSLLADYKSDLLSHGVDLTIQVTGVTTWDVDGGKKITHNGGLAYLLDINCKVMSEKAFGYQGGVLYADFQKYQGSEPSTKVGSFNEITTIEAPPFTQLSELWYSQTFYKTFTILVGKNDASYIFDSSPSSKLFQNASFDQINTIVDFPYYPNPAMGVVFTYSPNNSFTLNAGIYDGTEALGFNTGTAGVFGHFFNHLFEHCFLIQELDFFWNPPSKLNGEFGIGAWETTAKLTTFDNQIKKGSQGIYVFLDQCLFQQGNKSLTAFFEYGFAHPSISPIRMCILGGVNIMGLDPNYPNDSLGLAVSGNYFSHSPGSPHKGKAETVFEAYYYWEINQYFNLQPDVQYIVDPDGNNPTATVIMLQANLKY